MLLKYVAQSFGVFVPYCTSRNCEDQVAEFRPLAFHWARPDDFESECSSMTKNFLVGLSTNKRAMQRVKLCSSDKRVVKFLKLVVCEDIRRYCLHVFGFACAFTKYNTNRRVIADVSCMQNVKGFKDHSVRSSERERPPIDVSVDPVQPAERRTCNIEAGYRLGGMELDELLEDFVPPLGSKMPLLILRLERSLCQVLDPERDLISSKAVPVAGEPHGL